MAAAADLSWLADRLAAAGYDDEAPRRCLGFGGLDDVGLLNRATAIERCRHDSSPIASLLRLFFLEVAEPIENLRGVFDDMDLARLQRSGLVRTVRSGRERSLVGRLRIDVASGLFVLADRRFHGADVAALGLPEGDPVYPPSCDSLLLAELLDRAGPGPALDLCTGSGVLGLLLARRGCRTRAVDVNPRAVALATLNARLNQVDDFQVVEADLYRREGSRRFSVITANPPFVTSPHEAAPSFHAGGPTGDRVLRRILRGLGRALADDGRAFAIAHVGVRRGRDLEAAAQNWFQDFPGSALVVEFDRGGPVDLAAAQALYALDRGLASYADEVRQWAAFLHGHGIESVCAVLIAARQDGERGVRVVDARPKTLPIPLGLPAPDVVRRWLD